MAPTQPRLRSVSIRTGDSDLFPPAMSRRPGDGAPSQKQYNRFAMTYCVRSCRSCHSSTIERPLAG